ncbi:MAG TPA: DUF2252 family protein, partial [Polyangiaceae bacterium]
MITPDPVELAEWQLARDRKATARFTGMFQRRRAKMAVSPLSYLRGGAATFYRLLADFPELREGPPGEGWICGDAHLENFGVYRADEKRDDQRAIVFDLNDFDEAAMGPFRYDVLRLVTSLILGGRELGASGTRSLGLCSQLLAAYAGAVCEEIPLPEVPPPIARLLGKVEQRSGRDMLDQRTEVANGLRRFVLDERYTALPAGIAAAAPIAFEAYASALGGTWFDAVDVAFRIAGTGGLGTLRVAVLARDRDNPEKYRLFDMKESLAPCAAMVLKPPDLPQNV